MLKSKKLTTTDEIKAFSDPYRMKILSAFYKINRPATSKEVADSIGEVPAKVYYHVKKLEGVGILELKYTKEIKGIIAKYYEPTAKGFNIVGDDNISDPMKKVFLNEITKLVSLRYDESKKIFIDEMNKLSKDKSDDSDENNGTIMERSIYADEKEMKDFLEYVSDFCESHDSNAENNGNKELSKYHVFFTQIKVEEDSSK